MAELISYRAKVREALWLFWLLSVFAEPAIPEKQWRVVLAAPDRAAVVSDTDLGARLSAPEATVRRWRIRLEAAGLIRATKAESPRARSFEVLNLEYRLEGEIPANSAPKGFLN